MRVRLLATNADQRSEGKSRARGSRGGGGELAVGGAIGLFPLNCPVKSSADATFSKNAFGRFRLPLLPQPSETFRT